MNSPNPTLPPRVVVKSRDELQADRARLIAKSGMSEAMLFERGERFELYPEHRSIYEMVTSIDYLLGAPQPVEETPHA